MHYKDHPLAEIFPLMSDDELQELADDIRENGLRDHLYLFEGKILDGRNRYRACKLAEVAPRVQEYKGHDPLGFVISKNLHRRHLDASQRAMVAEKLAAKLQQNGDGVREAIEKAAKAVNVGERSVYTAKEVTATAVPELTAAVESGDVPVSTAAKVARLPKAEQRAAVKGGPAKVKEAAKKATAERNGKHEQKPTDAEQTADADPSEAFCETVGTLCRDIDALIRRVDALKESPFGRFVHHQSAVSNLKGARETLWGGRPTHECPYCKVAGESQPNCRCCRGLGVTTKSSYKAGVAAVGSGD